MNAPRASPTFATPDQQSRPEPNQTHHRAPGTKRRILLAAARLFRDQGYKATTLRDIAKASRLATGSMYYHFSSKEELLNQVLDDGIAAFDLMVREAVGAAAPGASELDRLHIAVRTHLHALLDASEVTRAYPRVFAQLPISMRQRNHAKRLLYFDFWRHLFERGQASGELHPDMPVGPIVDLLIAAMGRVHDWYDPAAPVGADTAVGIDMLARSLLNWLIKGIGAPDRS
jgi:TetR/AcrR family transcriptional regulator, cholesterol catabolism regulator